VKEVFMTVLGGAIGSGATIAFIDLGMNPGFALMYSVLATFVIMWFILRADYHFKK
jgi:hypothetical protein